MCNFFIFEKLEHLLCDCHAKGYNLVHYLSMMSFLVSLVSKTGIDIHWILSTYSGRQLEGL